MAERKWYSRLLGTAVELHWLVSGLLVVAAVVASVFVDRVQNGWRLAIAILVDVLVSGAIWALGEWRARRLQTAQAEARAETLLAIGYALAPLAREIGRVAAMGRVQRRQQRSGLVAGVLAAAQGLGPSQIEARSSYFRLIPGPVRMMVHESSTGRGSQAKARFEAGTEAGDTALRMIDEGESLFCDDVDANPPPGWEPSRRGDYKTFISVTVGIPHRPFGMLTLDATESGSLTEEDAQVLIVLGHLLGIVEAMTA